MDHALRAMLLLTNELVSQFPNHIQALSIMFEDGTSSARPGSATICIKEA